MNFNITRDNFFKALQKVINVIPSKSTVEILYNVLISTKDNKLSITATDLEITQIAWTDCNVTDEGEITVPGKLLLDIIRELPEVEITFISDENFIHPVIRAIILHFMLAYDHPFVDGNGRTARALFYWSMIII